MVTAYPRLRLPSFDPREVPVMAIDNHLPAVADERLAPDALQARFASPPRWLPEAMRDRPPLDGRPPVQAAVLVPIVLREGHSGLAPHPTVLLTERTAHLSSHSGQVAFPGGRVDPDDADAAAAALREAHEEVGLPAQNVQVIGTLPDYTTVTAYVVTPVVALVQPDFALRPNPDEVADAFEVPLAFLMNPANHRRHRMRWDDGVREWLSMPYYDTAANGDTRERFIWGATANMLRNLYRFLSA